MRFIVLTVLLFASASAAAATNTTPATPVSPEIDVCMRAAAATDHVPIKEVDRGACECATQNLHKLLKPGDFDLHEQMLETIANGADEKTFNKQMSDIMLKRGMNQTDVDKFLARVKAAERRSQDDCNPSILLDPGKTH